MTIAEGRVPLVTGRLPCFAGDRRKKTAQ
jgi:hypothetical protein